MLIHQFYYLEDDLNRHGLTREKDILSYIGEMASTILKALEGLSDEGKTELLRKGIEIPNGKPTVQENGFNPKESARKWYQFWK